MRNLFNQPLYTYENETEELEVTEQLLQEKFNKICGKCCIKKGMSKADRLEMFWSIERNMKRHEMYCSECQGRFTYGANGALTTKGGE